MSELADLDVSDPALYHDDRWRPAFAQLRQQAPVHYCKDSAYGPYWSVSNYQFIEEVELNSKVFSNRADLGGIQINDIART